MRSVLAAFFLIGAATLSAATIPFSEGFGSGGGGDPTPGEFTEVTSGAWTLQPPVVGGQYQNFISVSGSMFSAVSLTSSSAVTFPALPGTDFTMTTEFQLDALTVTGSEVSRAFVGLAVLAADANYAETVGSRYQLQFVLDGAGSTTTGSLEVTSFNAPGSTITAKSAGTLPVSLGVEYTLSITGVYGDGDLTLTGTLTSTAGSISVTDVETSTVLAGTNFGFLDNVLATGAASVASVDVDYDYLTVDAASAPSDRSDFDADDDVDGADFLAWSLHVGLVGTATPSDGDADRDLDVDGDDLTLWRAAYGFGAPATVVPEPGGGLAVIALAACWLAARGARRRRAA